MHRPAITHDYSRHHLLDPERWEHLSPRDDDIIISTPQKAGTTWTQAIVANLVFQDGRLPGPVGKISPWLDMRLRPFEPTMAALEAQEHRRFIKTHLPLNGLRFFEHAKYIVVGRDARDAFMSLLNHHRSYSPEIRRVAAQFDDIAGGPFPFDVGDDRAFWRRWITESWFHWESDGYPYWSHFGHIQSWWNFRGLPNVLLVHFEDLSIDPEAEIRRIATFLGIEIDESRMPGILKRTTFGEMKKNFDQILPEMNMIMRRGGNDFMHRGTNGRWRGFLEQEDLQLYRRASRRVLTPQCARWLEGGRRAVDPGATADDATARRRAELA